jgi:hypothetical protein
MCMRLIYGICVCAHSDDLLRPMYCWPRRWQYTVCVCVCVEYRAYVHAFDIRYYVYVRIPVPGPAQCTAGRGGGNIRDIVLYILILKRPIHTKQHLYCTLLILISKYTFVYTHSIYTYTSFQTYFCMHTQHLYYTLLILLSKYTCIYSPHPAVQMYLYILNVPLYTKCTFIY